jgi:hypothetical protein
MASFHVSRLSEAIITVLFPSLNTENDLGQLDSKDRLVGEDRFEPRHDLVDLSDDLVADLLLCCDSLAVVSNVEVGVEGLRLSYNLLDFLIEWGLSHANHGFSE